MAYGEHRSAGTLRFDGRAAIVTGGGRGIGREEALLLAARGASVVVNDVGWDVDGNRPSTSPADEVVAEIRAAGGSAAANYDSVADKDGPKGIVRTALDAFGRVDILINNAGIMIPGSFDDFALDDLRRLFEIHVIGSYGVTQAAWPHLVAAGYGRVVNTISGSMLGMPGLTGYTTVKAALLSLTRSLALEAAQHGIGVNAFAPTAYSRMVGVMPSSLFDPQRAEEMRKRSADLVAPVAAFLAHESCDLNGELLYASGGVVGRFIFELAAGQAKPDLSVEDVAAEYAALAN